MLQIETYREILIRQGFTPHGEALGVKAYEFHIRHPQAPNLTLEARLPKASILGVEETDCLLYTLLNGQPVVYPWQISEPLNISLHLNDISAPSLAERLVFATVLSFMELPVPEDKREALTWQN